MTVRGSVYELSAMHPSSIAYPRPASRTRRAAAKEDGHRVVVGLGEELAGWWGDDVLSSARGGAGEGRCGDSVRGGACCLRIGTVRHASPRARFRKKSQG